MKRLIAVSILILLTSCGSKTEEIKAVQSSVPIYEDELKLASNNTISGLASGDELLIEIEAFDLIPKFEVEDRYIYGNDRDDYGCWVKWRNYAGTSQVSIPSNELVKELRVWGGGIERTLESLIVKKVYWDDEDSHRIGLLIRVDDELLNGDQHIEVKSTWSSPKIAQKLGFMSWNGHCKWVREISDDVDPIRSMTEVFYAERSVRVRYRVYRR